ncbi:MAG: hypothetical protein ABJP87_04405 [Bauldia litoralis]|uniref:hypothetical protein n=1 Tax=Bauldia litoralis TaxID=665467 RepID=UPI00329A59FF
MSDALTTKERVKDRLKITSTDFDDLFDRLIVSTTARMSKMCNRRFLQATYTNQLCDGADIYGSRMPMLILKNAPVHSIESVQYKTGANSGPTWYSYTVDDYDVDMDLGILYLKGTLPRGKQNIRVTYTAGWSGTNIGIDTYLWVFNSTPTGSVNGSNLTFTLAANADQIIVYADGIRVSAANIAFTGGTATFTLAAGQAPYSTIAVDYKPTSAVTNEDSTVPEDLAEVCEEVVVRLFKRRDSEGRAQESFNESSITWNTNVFTKENLATIKNYRRGSFI